MPQDEGHRGLLATGRNWGQAWSLQKEAPPLGFWTSGLPNCGRTSFCCSRYLLQRPDEANTEHGLPDSRCHGVTERLNKELRPKETRGHEDRAQPGFFRHRGSCGDSWPDLIVSEELLCGCSFRPCHDYVGVSGPEPHCLWETHRKAVGATGTSGSGANSGMQENLFTKTPIFMTGKMLSLF